MKKPEPRRETFDAWAPRDAVWSPWVKPVLFSLLLDAPPRVEETSLTQEQVAWLPQADGATAVVADLPGSLGVAFGLAAARRGYRPIPLYNGIPWPNELFEDWAKVTDVKQPVALVNVVPIMRALWHGAAELRTAELKVQAPPLFLLDADRRGAPSRHHVFGMQGVVEEGRFDNRSLSWPADFPSAQKLRECGIEEVIIVSPASPAFDLANTLFPWQQGGLRLQIKLLDDSATPAPLVVKRPGFLYAALLRLFSALHLHPSPLGGYGGTVASG